MAGSFCSVGEEDVTAVVFEDRGDFCDRYPGREWEA
jgi:hypothetical protein